MTDEKNVAEAGDAFAGKELAAGEDLPELQLRRAKLLRKIKESQEIQIPTAVKPQAEHATTGDDYSAALARFGIEI